jgi:hypothetical protein
MGPTGPKGDPGESIKGDPGERGDDGKDGASFHTGIGPPSFEAKSGDAYMDVTTGMIYRWL